MYTILRNILIENPKLISALAAWLAGYTRYDIVKIFNIDLELLRKYNIIIDEFGEYVSIIDKKFRRYEKESIENIVRLSNIDPIEMLITLLRDINFEEAKILAYTSDFIKRYGKFSLYGISDYIRCVEKPENVNIEFKVLITLQKYLIYMCDRAHRCEEYSWTNKYLEILHKILLKIFKLPNDDDILKQLSKFIDENVSNLEVLAAMYSMCTGTIDQFQLFHKCRVQDVLKDIREIDYVYYNGFVNPLSLDLIVKIIIDKVISRIVEKIENVFKCRAILLNNDLNYIDYKICDVVIRFPKMYYLSPIFWAKPNAINVLYHIPRDVRSYVTTYRPYFEGGFLIISQGYNILKIFE